MQGTRLRRYRVVAKGSKLRELSDRDVPIWPRHASRIRAFVPVPPLFGIFSARIHAFLHVLPLSAISSTLIHTWLHQGCTRARLFPALAVCAIGPGFLQTTGEAEATRDRVASTMKRAWASIPAKKIHGLVRSMDERIDAGIAAESRHTRFRRNSLTYLECLADER